MMNSKNEKEPQVYFYNTKENDSESSDRDDVPEGRYGEEPYGGTFIDPDAVLPPPSDLLIGGDGETNAHRSSDWPESHESSEVPPKGS